MSETCVHCSNGGTCVTFGPQLNEYKCLCLPGFQGRHCEADIDECESQLAFACPPGATCSNTVGSYTCQCPLGQIMLRSACVNKLTCRDLPCLNGALCYNVHGAHRDYSCECELGFRGVDCEEVLPECGPNTCGQNGVCYSTDKGFSCECLTSYYGRRCQNKKLKLPAPAKHGKLDKPTSSKSSASSPVAPDMLDVVFVGTGIFVSILFFGCVILYLTFVVKRYRVYQQRFHGKGFRLFVRSMRDTCSCKTLLDHPFGYQRPSMGLPSKAAAGRLKILNERIDKAQHAVMQEFRSVSVQLSQTALRSPAARKSLDEVQRLLEDRM